MRNITRKLLFILSIVVILTGCPTEDDPNNNINNFRFTKDYWGEWVRLDTGEIWYLNDKEIQIHNVPYPNKLTLRKENKNAIEVTEGSRKYYIYASRVKNASFSGRVVDGSGNVIGGSEQGVGSIAVVISNLANTSDETTVVTDEEGNYIVNDIIPWDTYTVTVDGKTWTVTPGDGDDVGIMALRDGVNLKAYLSADDTDRLFDYEQGFFLYLDIKNVGDTAVSQGTYAYCTLESPGIYPSKLSTPPGEHISLGGLRPGLTERTSYILTCDSITEGSSSKKIGVTIVDPEANITWQDYASIKVRKPVSLYIKAQSSVQGIVITPYKKAYMVKDNLYGAEITLPWYSDDYILILTSPGNTTYSIGVGIAPSVQWANLVDRNMYKPHNTEDTATPIGMYEEKMAFLNKGELAYYRINMGDTIPNNEGD